MQQQILLPFTLEPVTADRVQFWMQYGGQASTQNEFDVVSEVYTAFWHEAQAYESYERVLRWLECGDITHAIGWADLIMQSLQSILDNWQAVCNRMEAEWRAASYEWYRNAVARRDLALSLQPLVSGLVIEWCTQQQVPTPRYTYAFAMAAH